MITDFKEEQNKNFKMLIDLDPSDITEFQYKVSPSNRDLFEKEGQETNWISNNYINRCLSGWRLYDVQSRQLWNTWLTKAYETPDVLMASADDIVDYGYITKYSKIIFEKAFSCLFKVGYDRETDFETEVAKKFKDVPEVEAIYVDSYLETKRFQILTSNRKYDDQLMEKLISIEYELKVAYRDMIASFEYIPKVYEQTNEIIRSESKLIYKRGYNVFFVGTSVASEAEREVSEALA